MECPSCKKETHKLTITAEGSGCRDCLRVEYKSLDGLLHRVKFRKWGVRMTEADANRIKTNKKRADGRYSPDPRWR